MRALTTFLIGLVFGLGIVISGMANPAKVLNFFDIAGTWDPGLAFVSGGAVLTAFFGYRIVLNRPTPLFESGLSLPTRSDLDYELIGGSALFGIGWGIAGFCPGAALPVPGTGKSSVIMFVVSLVVGMLAWIIHEITKSFRTPFLCSEFCSDWASPVGNTVCIPLPLRIRYR